MSGRPSLEGRKSTSNRLSQASQGPPPPPSPKKTDGLKRVLSLRNLTGRTSVEEKRTSPKLPPSPFKKPEIERFAASFGPDWAGPQYITWPIISPPPHTPQGYFEGPRAAPSPPLLDRPISDKRSQPFGEIKANASTPVVRKDLVKHDSADPIKAPNVPEHEMIAAPGTAITSPIRIETQSEVQPAHPPSPRPLLRRKTSKFIEHIDEALPITFDSPMKKEARKARPSPIFLPPFDFQLPSPPVPADTPRLERTLSPMRSVTVKAVRSPVPNLGPWEQQNARKRSASNMKSLPPTPGPVIKRSMSTRTRPTPSMSDVSMAQLKPIFLGPVIASGHARMISC